MAPRNRTTDEVTEDTEGLTESLTEKEEAEKEEAVEEDTNGNGSYVPSRAAVSTEIPGRTRRSSDYSAWQGEINALATESLGQAFSYEDVPNVSGLAQGLKRVYGVHAETRDIVTKDMVKDDPTLAPRQGHGTLWISYEPMLTNGKLDTAKVDAQRAKYTK